MVTNDGGNRFVAGGLFAMKAKAEPHGMRLSTATLPSWAGTCYVCHSTITSPMQCSDHNASRGLENADGSLPPDRQRVPHSVPTAMC